MKKKAKAGGKTRRECLETTVFGGIKEEIMPADALPGRINKSRYAGYENFMLKDGRYAYRDVDCENPKKPVFYHVLTVEDESLIPLLLNLDDLDRHEEESNRRYRELQSYRDQNYKKKKADDDDDDDGWVDPTDLEAYRESQREETAGQSMPFPVKSEYAVIRAAIKQMTPADRAVFGMYLSTSLTDSEIKDILELRHSSWSNEKKRLVDRMRKVFDSLGYDTKAAPKDQKARKGRGRPDSDGHDRLEQESRRRIAAAYKAEDDEEEERILGKDIAREAALEQSQKKRWN